MDLCRMAGIFCYMNTACMANAGRVAKIVRRPLLPVITNRGWD